MNSVVKDDGKPASNRSYPKDYDINAFMMMESIDCMEDFNVLDNNNVHVGEFYIDRYSKLRRSSETGVGVSTSIMWNLLLGRYTVMKHNSIIKLSEEDNSMIKYAIVRMKNNRNYTFMHYEDLKLKQGDTVVCDTAQGLEIGIITEIDSTNLPKADVSKFILQKVDISAFNEMN